MIRPAFRYYGSKFRIAPWIISFFPAHNNYVEPFGGSAAVLLHKPRSSVEVYNDLDGDIVNYFRILRERKKELIEKIQLTPWARDEFEICRHKTDDPLENARRFYVSSFLSIRSIPHDQTSGWAHREKNACHGQCSFWGERTEYLFEIVKRLSTVMIENKDGMDIIKNYDNPNTLIYLDPPYLRSVRSRNAYHHEMGDESSHRKLAELLKNCKAHIILSGYTSPLYKELYEDSGWARYDKDVRANHGVKRTESLWLSPRTVESYRRNGVQLSIC